MDGITNFICMQTLIDIISNMEVLFEGNSCNLVMKLKTFLYVNLTKYWWHLPTIVRDLDSALLNTQLCVSDLWVVEEDFS